MENQRPHNINIIQNKIAVLRRRTSGGTSKKRRQVPEGMMLGERGALFFTEKAFGWFEEPDDDDDTESGGLVLSGEKATVDADEDDVKKHIHPSGKKILIAVDDIEISTRKAAAAA